MSRLASLGWGHVLSPFMREARLWRDQLYGREVGTKAVDIARQDGPLHDGGVRADVEIGSTLSFEGDRPAWL